jgi:hypothetical protein
VSLQKEFEAVKVAALRNPTLENKERLLVLAKAVEAEKSAKPKSEIDEAEVQKAMRLYEKAHEWPRCGEGWPFGQKEEQAMSLLVKYAREKL